MSGAEDISHLIALLPPLLQDCAGVVAEECFLKISGHRAPVGDVAAFIS